ncbi:hypothetical protein EIP91_003316 [Steccherinum ochraceum]|uniref:Uncharacterized protein n=1 Tax=Steccherinum ochraceum TaxID=92696 RepID=A0A4V2MW62_9APHY|nr:hypothetical protein EIP91_003316 [Steccherinum ochraceum]
MADTSRPGSDGTWRNSTGLTLFEQHRPSHTQKDVATHSDSEDDTSHERRESTRNFIPSQSVVKDDTAKQAGEQTDLLLDIAMTTAFASLLDGTPISDWTSLFSFVSVFFLIWWVWASQVLYHARFREKDWIHVILYFVCQLAIFMSFTAFTSNFDVEDGIAMESTDDTLDGLRHAQGWTPFAVLAQHVRDMRIPVRSMRGISMTMALSRVMILIEYLCAIRRLLYDPNFVINNPARSLSCPWYCAGCWGITTHWTVTQEVVDTNQDSMSRRDLPGGPAENPSFGDKEAEPLSSRHKDANADAPSRPRDDPSLRERLCRFQQKELILWHCGSVLVSFWCYILAFILIGSEPSRADQVARVCLWYPPIILEILAHFAVATIVENKEWQYDAAAVHARRSVIFTIILGAGLDNMTDNFHFMVGNVSFGTHRIFIIICAGLNIIFLFTLHYTNFKTISEKSNSKTKRRRVLASFVLNFFYLCALVVTLQGMSAIIQIGNIGDTLDPALTFLRETESFLNFTHFAIPLDPSAYDILTVEKLQKAGYNVTDLVEEINHFIPSPYSNDSAYPYRVALLADMDIIASGLRAINILPQDSSISSNEIYAFLDTAIINPSNTSIGELNKPLFIDVTTTALTANTESSSWFTAAGGLVLILLACMELLDHWRTIRPYMPLLARGDERLPEAGWREQVSFAFQIAGKMVIGVVLISLTALGIHGGQIMLDDDYRFVGSRIWKLAIQSWLLPVYVLVLFILQCYEYGLVMWYNGNLRIGESLRDEEEERSPAK